MFKREGRTAMKFFAVQDSKSKLFVNDALRDGKKFTKKPRMLYTLRSDAEGRARWCGSRQAAILDARYKGKTYVVVEGDGTF
jgi:hypothetical protein